MKNDKPLLSLFFNLINKIKLTNSHIYILDFLKIKILIYIIKLKFLLTTKRKNKFNISDIVNFTSLLKLSESMDILEDLDIHTDVFDSFVKIYSSNESDFLGISLSVEIRDENRHVLDFNLKSKQNNYNKPFLELNIKRYDSDLDVAGIISGVHYSHHMTNLDFLEKIKKYNNSNDVIMNTSFIIIKNIISMYYSYIFDNLERRYLYEKKNIR